MDVSGFISDETPGGGLTIGSPPPRVPMLVRVREELEKAAGDSKVQGPDRPHQQPGRHRDRLGHHLPRAAELRSAPAGCRSSPRMMDVAASGGYYIALAADTIVAHPTTVTGSIGVIVVTLNAEGLMQKIGLAANAIKSGERKDMGSPFRALTPEERAIFQAVIDDLQRQFVAHLVERRKIAPATAASAGRRAHLHRRPGARASPDRSDRLHAGRARGGAPRRRPDRGARRGLQAPARVPGDLLRASRQRRRAPSPPSPSSPASPPPAPSSCTSGGRNVSPRLTPALAGKDLAPRD